MTYYASRGTTLFMRSSRMLFEQETYQEMRHLNVT